MTKSNFNIEELLQQFDAENAHKLGAAAGLNPEVAERLLERGVRTQLETLASHARSETGQRQVLEAIDRLPQFGSVEGGLTEQGGAESLKTAGEILSPTLLGHDQSDMAGQLSRIEGAPKDSIQGLLYMSLPLLLSFMGGRGLNRSTITEIMSGIRSGGLRPRSLGGSYVSRAAQQAQQAQQAQAQQAQQGGSAAKKAKAQAPTAPEAKPETATWQPSQATAKLQEGDRPEPPRTNGREPSHSTDIGPGLEPPTPPVGQPATKRPTDAKAKGSLKPASSSRLEEEPEQAGEPEQADDDYSKESVISTLLDDEAVAEAAQELGKAAPDETASSPVGASDTATGTANTAPTAQPEAKSKISTGPAAPSTSAATKPAADTSAMTEPAKPQPTAGAAAVAAAAAAAGVGAGVAAGKSTVQPKEGQPKTASQPPAQGSPWKSPKPRVTGTQPSPTVKKPVGPTAVPVTPTKPATPTQPAAPAQPAAPTQPVATPAAKQEGFNANALLETFRTQFLRAEAGALAEATGFSKSDRSRAVRATVPVVLSAAAQKAATPEGAAELMKLAEGHARVTKADGTLDAEVLGRRADLGALEVRGISELGQLMDNPAEVSGRLGTALGASGEQAGRLLALMAPVVLGLLGRQAAGASAADLGRVLGELRPRLEELLPEGMGVMKALLGQTLYGAAPKQRTTLLETKQAKAAAVAAPAAVVVEDAKPAAAPMQPEPTKPVTPPPPPPAEPERSGGFPWWILLALALLAGLAWYFSNQNQATPVPEVEPAVTQPAEEVEPAVSEADIASAPGTEAEEIVPAEEDIALGTAAGEGEFAVLTPEEGQSVPDTGFDMSGTGVAGATYQLFEDGVSVGTFTADDSGLWQVDVAAPAAGDHTYAVRGADGNEVLSRAITVDVTAAAAQCSEALSLSLSDGENVNAPFRFGGVGDASGYQVRVLRGSEEIGSEDIQLASNCTWNYLSQPGGEAGTEEAITYEVRSLDNPEAEPLQSITLNVLQAGE